MDHLVHLDLLDRPDQPDKLEILVLQDHQVQQVLLEHQVQQVNLEGLVLLAEQDFPDSLDRQAVQVP